MYSIQIIHCFPLQRLQGKVLKLVDVSYGGENGFNQAIELSAEVLSNVKFIQEKKLIGRYSWWSETVLIIVTYEGRKLNQLAFLFQTGKHFFFFHLYIISTENICMKIMNRNK